MMTADTLNMDARYTVAGYRGVAWYLVGYDTTMTAEAWTFAGTDDDDPEDDMLYVYDEPEEVEDRERVRAIMVGDDRVFIFDVDELSQIEDEDYCHECGQIGCTADGRN
jgi:hypothetical protein